MARYYRRRYRRYYRRRPRRYVRRWFRRRMSRFVNGSSKSTIRVKIPVSTTFQVASVDAAGTLANPVIRPFAGSSSPFSALTSPLYRLYATLYDEVKCIGGKVVLSVGTPIGTSSVPSATFITAWDRRCGYSSDGVRPTFAQLSTYSSQQKAVAVNNSIAKLVRSCYASDLMEKAQWHDCTVEDNSGTYIDAAFETASNNPNFFCPGMYLGVSQTGSTAQNIDMQADITWYFAFRNPKYGASASSSKGVVEGEPTLDVDVDDLDAAAASADMDVSIPSTRALVHTAVVADRADPILSHRPSRKERRALI